MPRPPFDTFTAYRYTPFSIRLEIFAADGTTPRDLTGSTLRADLRNGLADAATVAASFDISLASDPTTGIATAKLTAAQTEALTHGAVYFFDVLLTPATGDAETLPGGRVDVVTATTRPAS